MSCKKISTNPRPSRYAQYGIFLAMLSIGCSSMSGTWYVRAIDGGILRGRNADEYHEINLKSDGTAEADVLITKLRGKCSRNRAPNADYYWRIDTNNTKLHSLRASLQMEQTEKLGPNAVSIELTCDGAPLKDMQGEFLFFCEDYSPGVKQCSVHSEWSYYPHPTLPSPVVLMAREKSLIEEALGAQSKRGQEVAGYKFSHGDKDEYSFCRNGNVLVSRHVVLTEGIRPGVYGFDFSTKWHRHQDTIRFPWAWAQLYNVHRGFRPDPGQWPRVDVRKLTKLERLNDHQAEYGCINPSRAKPR